MKNAIRRFLDFMEKEPAYKTIWFLPLTILLWLGVRAQKIFQPKQGDPMAKPTFKSRVISFLKRRKKNPDWARVDEPDNILPSFMIMIFGFIVSVLSMMAAYSFMTGALENWIASFLAAQTTDLPFNQLYAAFTAVLVLLIDFLILFALSVFRVADHDDIVEMVSDLDENIQERIVELENTLTERLDRIIQNEVVTYTEDEFVQVEERIDELAGQTQPSQ